MKALHTLLILLIPFIFSCSSSSSNEDLTPQIEQSIINKTWKLNDVDTGWFKLNYDNTYSTKEYYCDSLENFGTWELNGNILTKQYIEGFSQFNIQLTILEYNDSLMILQNDTSSNLDVNIIYEIEDNVIWGCQDSLAVNFNPYANCPVQCDYAGCTDEEAINYNPSANIDDGSCDYLSELAIGATYQGGIIFWLDGNGGGLISAPSDQSISATFCYTTNDIFYISTGTAIGTGFQNTMEIIAECSTPGSAADICASLNLGGYTDWFLPSIDELHQMYYNIGQSNNLGLGNIGGFSNSTYWSSSHWSGNFSHHLGFQDGFHNAGDAEQYLHVRAIRAF